MNATKSIVHFISSTSLNRGGPSISSTQLMEHHGQAGCPGILVCPDHQNDITKYAAVSSKVYSTLDELMACEPLDSLRAFHLHGIWDLFLHRAARVARKSRIPYVISPRGMLEPWALNQKKWKKQLAWWLYQRHDLNRATFLHATAISEAQQLKHMGLSVPVEVVPNGVTLPSIQTRKSATERTVLFLSRIHPKKGLLLLADAWAKVRPSGWKMLVVGPDEDGHRNEVQNRVSELGIGSSWEFQDSVFGEQKTQVFQQAAIFVLPTHSENFGIAIAEALSCGLPVITTTQAPWEGLITNRCGWWVPADSRQLASALAEATSLSLEELHQMGERGRRWVQDEFAWPSIAERLLKAYDKYVP